MKVFERIDNGSNKDMYRITKSGEKILQRISGLLQCLLEEREVRKCRYENLIIGTIDNR